MSYEPIPAEDIGSYPVLVQDLKGLLVRIGEDMPNLKMDRYDPLLVLALLGIEFVKSRNNNIVSPQSIQSMMRRYSVVAPGEVDYVVMSDFGKPELMRHRYPALIPVTQPEPPMMDEQADDSGGPGALTQMTDEEVAAMNAKQNFNPPGVQPATDIPPSSPAPSAARKKKR